MLIQIALLRQKSSDGANDASLRVPSLFEAISSLRVICSIRIGQNSSFFTLRFIHESFASTQAMSTNNNLNQNCFVTRRIFINLVPPFVKHLWSVQFHVISYHIIFIFFIIINDRIHLKGGMFIGQIWVSVSVRGLAFDYAEVSLSIIHSCGVMLAVDKSTNQDIFITSLVNASGWYYCISMS